MTAAEPCARCEGERWVCEQHGGRWAGSAGDCGDPDGCPGPGMPCPVCNAETPGVFPAYPPGSVEVERFYDRTS